MHFLLNCHRTLVCVLLLSAVSIFWGAAAKAQSCSTNCTAHDHHRTSRLDFSDDSGQTYCSEYSACSVDGNLSGANDEELDHYKAETSLNGKTFSNWSAPDFTLPATNGEHVSLSDYHGQPVVMILMSAQCLHCSNTHEFLPALKKKYASKDLEILPVYVNSGSVSDVKSSTENLDLNYPVLVSSGEAISRMYDTRMVPSFFLIDRQGKITKKLVGYKSESTLDKEFAALAQR